MKLLVTNDDGINAPGLRALLRVAEQMGEPLVMAPHEEASGVSHRVTTSSPIRVQEMQSNEFAVFGTPSDCARLGAHTLEDEPFWMLSGINDGGNLGVDVWHSGTIAAVREAVIHGRPGIALSQYKRKGRAIDWQRAERWVLPVIRDLIGRPWQPGTFWSINLPCIEEGAPDPDVVLCALDPSPLPLGFRVDEEHFLYHGNYHERARVAGLDVDVCFSGSIAVTLMSLNC